MIKKYPSKIREESKLTVNSTKAHMQIKLERENANKNITSRLVKLSPMYRIVSISKWEWV